MAEPEQQRRINELENRVRQVQYQEQLAKAQLADGLATAEARKRADDAKSEGEISILRSRAITLESEIESLREERAKEMRLKEEAIQALQDFQSVLLVGNVCNSFNAVLKKDALAGGLMAEQLMGLMTPRTNQDFAFGFDDAKVDRNSLSHTTKLLQRYADLTVGLHDPSQMLNVESFYAEILASCLNDDAKMPMLATAIQTNCSLLLEKVHADLKKK